jgi:hypothetical protein
MHDPPNVAQILDDAKMIEKGAKARLFVKDRKGKAHGGGSESGRHTESLKTQSVNRYELEFAACGEARLT